jgi:hypothetical protein
MRIKKIKERNERNFHIKKVLPSFMILFYGVLVVLAFFIFIQIESIMGRIFSMKINFCVFLSFSLNFD